MKIVNVYSPSAEASDINRTASHLNPVSLTIPDQSLSIHELFEKYVDGTIDVIARQKARKAEYDAYGDQELSPDDYIPDMDAIEAYEAAYALARRQEKTEAEALQAGQNAMKEAKESVAEKVETPVAEVAED